MQQPEFIDVGGVPIAFRSVAGVQPGIVWLGGYKSDMRGTKAEALAAWAEAGGRAFLRHDYSGHGESGGDFAQGTISKWLAESLAVLGAAVSGRQILVGSSMGAWIALRMVQELQKAPSAIEVAGLVLIAPAPDFTAELVEPALTKAQKRELATRGYFERPSKYAPEPYTYSNALIEDGRRNLVLTGRLDTHCPVHILQGMQDRDVPHTHALKLAACLPADDVTLSLIPDGDHRLSRPQDIDMLIRSVAAMAG